MGFMMKLDGSMGIWYSMTIMMNGVFFGQKKWMNNLVFAIKIRTKRLV